MKPKQVRNKASNFFKAAGLLTNSYQYLIHSCVKGVKGRFEPVISWYQEVYANSKHLADLI
jgi:hypothetical protein